MANAFITPAAVSKEIVRLMEQELVLGNMVGVDISSEFDMVGSTVKVRRQAQYLGQDNNLDLTSFTEDVVEGYMTVPLDQTWSDQIIIDPLDATLSFDRWTDMILVPMARRAAERIENSLAALYYKFYNFDGTPGTPPSTFLTLANSGAYMTDTGIPVNGRIAVHPPVVGAALSNAVASSNVQTRNASALDKATIGYFAGFDNYVSAFTPTHTVGVATGAPVVNGAGQNVTYATVAAAGGWSQSLITQGWTNSVTGILKAGDVFTIAGVNSVHPGTKASTGRLQTFTVLADANSGATTGPATLTISPPIITTGAWQTVTAAPANGASITVKTGTGGTGYRQSLLLDPSEAICMVSRPIAVPDGMGVKTSLTRGNRVQVRVTESVNPNTLKHAMRFDMLWGREVLSPRRGLRLTS